MRVALAQTEIVWEDKEKNIAKAFEFIKRAKDQEADIILFPEMSFTGFSMNIDYTAESNEESLKKIIDLSVKEKIAIGFGWAERHNKKAYNHYTVVCDGKVILDYKKIHPFSYGNEDEFFESGNTIEWFEFKGYTWSALICYDLRFPEVFQVASDNADIIIVPANWPQKREDHWQSLLKARAIENQAYILGINCVGTIGELKYSGCSTAYDYNGKQLVEIGGEEGLLFVNIVKNVHELRTEFPLKKDRKWLLYSKMYKKKCCGIRR